MVQATRIVKPATPVIVHDWDRMATIKLDAENFPECPRDPFDPQLGKVSSEERIRNVQYNIDKARQSFDGANVWDGTKYAAPDTVPGTTGCFKPICNGADLVTVGNGDAMGFLSPDGWFYPARDGHSDCCRRLTLGLKIAVSLRGGPESGLMDEDGWVKFAVYGKQRLHEDEVYSYSAKDKKLSRKQQTFLLAAIKAAREAGWRVSDDFERRVLESNINH